MGKTEMRNWIDNIPAVSGQQDFQRSSWDMVEAARGAVHPTCRRYSLL